jgi:hypothetical protein
VLDRVVNPTVYRPREFREKLAAKNHFLSMVAKDKKIFVIGDEREFPQRVSDGSPRKWRRVIYIC